MRKTKSICHICILSTYNDGFGYQDNILPIYHKKMGYDTYRFLNRNLFIDGVLTENARSIEPYIDVNGIENIVFEKKNSHRWDIFNVRRYIGIYEKLCEIQPDIIFVHGGQTSSVFDIIRYKKKHPEVRIFADQHGDYYNMPINSGWRMAILTRVIYRHYVRSLAKYTEKYWGVTPWRVKYLQDVYGLKTQQTDLLIMGGDDKFIDIENQSKVRKVLRSRHNIQDDDFVVITGGKMDRAKNTIPLMQSISNSETTKLKLVVFGMPNEDIKEEFEQIISDNKNIIYIGWLKGKEVYDWFAASDLTIFPGTHSVLWEQAVACGIPAIFKRWVGMDHVDIGGNCKFTNTDSAEELVELVAEITNNKEIYISMKEAAVSDRRKEFLYSEIAKKSIGQ